MSEQIIDEKAPYLSWLPSQEQVNLELGLLSHENPSIKALHESYQAALTCFESGDSLAQYLTTLRFNRDYPLEHSGKDRFSDEQIAFVAEGRHSGDEPSDFDDRLAYALSQKVRFGYSRWPTYESFKMAIGGKLISGNGGLNLTAGFNSMEIEKEYIWPAIRISKGRLKNKFNAAGQRVNEQDDINWIMFQAMVKISQPKLAAFFAAGLESPDRRLDAYLLSHSSNNEALDGAQDVLENVPNEIDSNPGLMCRYLIGGLAGNTDKVADFTYGVVVITNEEKYFTNLGRQVIRSALTRALLKLGHNQLAQTVINSKKTPSKLSFMQAQEDGMEGATRRQRRAYKRLGETCLKQIDELDRQMDERVARDKIGGDLYTLMRRELSERANITIWSLEPRAIPNDQPSLVALYESYAKLDPFAVTSTESLHRTPETKWQAELEMLDGEILSSNYRVFPLVERTAMRQQFRAQVQQLVKRAGSLNLTDEQLEKVKRLQNNLDGLN